MVWGNNEAVFVDTVGEMESEGGGGKGDSRVQLQGSLEKIRNQLIGMQLCLLALTQENMELKSAINGLKMSMDCNFGIVNRSTRQLAMRPTTNVAVLAAAVTNQSGVAPQQPAPGGNRAMMLATLKPTPRSLHDLW